MTQRKLLTPNSATERNLLEGLWASSHHIMMIRHAVKQSEVPKVSNTACMCAGIVVARTLGQAPLFHPKLTDDVDEEWL